MLLKQLLRIFNTKHTSLQKAKRWTLNFNKKEPQPQHNNMIMTCSIISILSTTTQNESSLFLTTKATTPRTSILDTSSFDLAKMVKNTLGDAFSIADHEFFTEEQ
jgi:hypothetical protein